MARTSSFVAPLSLVLLIALTARAQPKPGATAAPTRLPAVEIRVERLPAREAWRKVDAESGRVAELEATHRQLVESARALEREGGEDPRLTAAVAELTRLAGEIRDLWRKQSALVSGLGRRAPYARAETSPRQRVASRAP